MVTTYPMFFETKHIMNALWKVDEMEVHSCHVTCFETSQDGEKT